MLEWTAPVSCRGRLTLMPQSGRFGPMGLGNPLSLTWRIGTEISRSRGIERRGEMG